MPVDVKPSQAQVKLMEAIGAAIKQSTLVAPLPLEDIVSVLAYTTGKAISHAHRSIVDADEMRRAAHVNIDRGMGGVHRKTSGLIVPATLQ